MVRSFGRLVRWIGQAEGIIAALCLTAAIAVNTVEIFARTLFRWSFGGKEELTIFLAVWSIFLGVGCLVSREGLLRMEMLSQKFGGKGARLLKVLAHLAMATLSVVYVRYGLQLQVMQALGKSAALGIRENLFSLPVLIAGATTLLAAAYVLLRELSGGEVAE